MKHLFRQLSGRGLELSHSTTNWTLILLALTAGTAVLTTLALGNLMREFSLHFLQDIATTANLLLAIFFSIEMASQASQALSSKDIKGCDAPFGMMSFMWRKIISAFLTAAPFFVVSSAMFMFVQYILFDRVHGGFAQSLIISAMAIIPLSGFAISAAIWLKGKKLLAVISMFFVLAFLSLNEIPFIFRALLPIMDFYQTDSMLVHGIYGSWLYVFSLLGLGLVWALYATSISSLCYNLLRGADVYPNDSKGAKVLASKLLILSMSLLLSLHISYQLREIEFGKVEFISGKALVPKVGFNGLWGDANYMFLCEILRHKADNNEDSNKIDHFFEKTYVECLSIKPSFELLNKTAISFLKNTVEENNKLTLFVMENYFKNPYLKRDPMFEYHVVLYLVNPNNPARENYLKLVSKMLRESAKIANLEEKQLITKRIVNIDREIIEKQMWKNALMPLNKDFAELLVWYREWKRSISLKYYEPLDDPQRLEKYLLSAADNAEKNSNGNPEILASVERIRRSIYLAKYVSSDKVLSF